VRDFSSFDMSFRVLDELERRRGKDTIGLLNELV
jgi:hypothetical protein